MIENSPMIFLRGIGIDIIDIQDIEKLQNPKRFLTLQESKYCNGMNDPLRHIAGRMAAKEAIFKALLLKGPKISILKDIEVFPKSDGGLEVKLSGEIISKCKEPLPIIFLSISHSKNSAVAVAICFNP